MRCNEFYDILFAKLEVCVASVSSVLRWRFDLKKPWRRHAFPISLAFSQQNPQLPVRCQTCALLRGVPLQPCTGLSPYSRVDWWRRITLDASIREASK